MFSDKIKTAREVLLGLHGTTIMCHGTFDVVHPGHIQHLLYCKSKADILVASITADRHINKRDLSPFVPEALRAQNLAVMEMVDYVIIDQNPTPIENIKLLKPDYFAKGYDYAAAQGKTLEEQQAVESYGGEMIFTPGDVVYSSSKLLQHTPNLAAEKLKVLMQSEGISFGDLRLSIEAIKGVRCHVVGDTIVDSYTNTSLVGSGTKTPTLSVRHESRRNYVGGAAIVARHLLCAGAEVTFSTILGNDHLAEFVLDEMKGVRLNVSHDDRPTVNKNVFICNEHRLLKVDTLDNRSISEHVTRQIATQLETPTDAVLFADFRHGIFNKHTIPFFTQAIPALTFRAADSQVASRWGNILDFTGFDLITPNEREARFALGDQDSVVRPLALELYRRAQCKNLILKLGERGCLTYRMDTNGDPHDFFTIDSFADSVVDPVGAGDALLAYATLAQVAVRNPAVASIIGSIAAGIACGSEGNIPVTPEQILAKIGQLERKVNFESA